MVRIHGLLVMGCPFIPVGHWVGTARAMRRPAAGFFMSNLALGVHEGLKSDELSHLWSRWLPVQAYPHS